MAITINQDPTTGFVFLPTDNPIEYLINSSNSAQPNFRVNATVYYDTAGANTLLATIKKPIEYGTTKAIIDVSEIVRSKDFEQYPYTLLSGTAVTITELKTWQVRFQEFYGTTPAVSGAVSSGVVFPTWHGAFRYDERQSTIWKLYAMISGQNKHYLTNFANYESRDVFAAITAFNTMTNLTPVRKIRYNESVYAYSLLSQVTGVPTLNIAIFNEQYTLIDNKQLSGASITGKHVRCDWRITPEDLAADYGFSANNVASAKYIQIYSSVPTNYVVSKAFFFEIDWCQTPKWGSTFELKWLNHYGGWDSYVFTGRWSKQSQSDKSILKNDVTRRISGSTLVNNAYARRTRQYHTGVIEQYTISEGNMSQVDYDGIEDVFHSPAVFWNDAGTWKAVQITDTTYQGKQTKQERQLSVQMTFEIDMNNTTQQW